MPNNYNTLLDILSISRPIFSKILKLFSFHDLPLFKFGINNYINQSTNNPLITIYLYIFQIFFYITNTLFWS